jgi:hypothetical protein
VRKPEGGTPVGRLGCKREDSKQMDLRGRNWGRTDWIHVVQQKDLRRALMKTTMELRAA